MKSTNDLVEMSKRILNEIVEFSGNICNVNHDNLQITQKLDLLHKFTSYMALIITDQKPLASINTSAYNYI